MRRWLPVLLWAGIILGVSSISDPFVVVPDAVTTQDETLGRFAHVAEYAILGVLLMRALVQKGRISLKLASAAAIGGFAFGLLDELFQSSVPERAFQLLDLGLDLSGILLGILVFAAVKSRG